MSPSYVSYIQWKPILKELIKENHKIDLLVPKPATYKHIILQLKEISKEINFQNIYFYRNPFISLFFTKAKLNKFEITIKSSEFNFFIKIRALLSRLEIKFREKRIYSIFGNFIRRLSSLRFFQKFYRNFLFKENWDYILYDISEEKKLYLYNLLH